MAVQLLCAGRVPLAWRRTRAVGLFDGGDRDAPGGRRTHTAGSPRADDYTHQFDAFVLREVRLPPRVRAARQQQVHKRDAVGRYHMARCVCLC